MGSFNLQNTNSDTCIKLWNKIVLDGVIKQILYLKGRDRRKREK